MADFEFWHRAELKFRRLQTAPPKPGEVHHASHNGLCAWWDPDGWHDGRPYRLFNDGNDSKANKNIERLFRIAAESAGVELGYPGGEAAVFGWLDRLRLAGLYVDGGPSPGSFIIHRVCDASAEHCLKCETDAKAAARTDQAKVKTAFGRNVDRLRKECGWSFDDLAKATELDKKLILGHVNDGKGAQPKTLEAYAHTFTEKLGRTVTVAELES